MKKSSKPWSHITLDVKWRPLWSGKERKLSYKTLRWLSRRWYEDSIDNDFSLGSEYAELDSKLNDRAIQHPIFEQVNGAFQAIVFGDEGMGKTASALQMAKKNQDLAKSDSKESKVFPVYAPFESGVDVKGWLVEKISRALIDFTADNPRMFITAPDSQKTAMGRLMLRHTQGVDALRLNFYSSPFKNNSTDLNQTVDYLKELNYVMPPAILTKEETLNLLYIARPDIFDQVYFLWDIRSVTPQEEVISKIREIEGLVLPLARQNLFIKIFAPLTIKKSLGNLAEFYSVNYDLIWSEAQLRELIEMRIKMFEALWERGIDDPTGFIAAAAQNSPRRVIRILNSLLDYVDGNLQDEDKFSVKVLSKLVTNQDNNGWLTKTQGQKRVAAKSDEAVFVSYAWGGESEHTVDELENAFADNSISIVRDKKTLNYTGSIEEFERRIGQGQCVVLVISNKYLRSKHCMYELILVNKNKDFRNRVFPLILADAGIFDPVDRLNYIKYWDNKIKMINRELKKIGNMVNVDSILIDLKIYNLIRASFDHLTDILSDMNALTPEIHAANGYSVIINAVKRSAFDK